MERAKSWIKAKRAEEQMALISRGTWGSPQKRGQPIRVSERQQNLGEGELSRQREQREQRQLRGGRTGRGEELGSVSRWQQPSQVGVGDWEWTEYPGRLALAPWAFGTFQICFEKESLCHGCQEGTGIRKRVEMCIFAYVFFFLFCYLKKRSQMQIDNCPVITGSKHIFLDMYLLSKAGVLHCRGSLHPGWSHSTWLRGHSWHLLAKGALQASPTSSPRWLTLSAVSSSLSVG